MTNWNYKVILTLGVLWLAVPAEAQTADSLITPPTGVRPPGPPPKRGAAPRREFSNADDTANAGKVVWEPRHLDFGTFSQDSTPVRELVVRNVSNENLSIQKVRVTCHCTNVDWPTEPIPPGKSGVIKVTYHADEPNEFLRILGIFTNFDPDRQVTVFVSGTAVKP